MTFDRARVLAQRTVAVDVHYAPTEYLLAHADLDGLARTLGRAALRMIVERIEDDATRMRVKEYLSRG